MKSRRRCLRRGEREKERPRSHRCQRRTEGVGNPTPAGFDFHSGPGSSSLGAVTEALAEGSQQLCPPPGQTFPSALGVLPWVPCKRGPAVSLRQPPQLGENWGGGKKKTVTKHGPAIHFDSIHSYSQLLVFLLQTFV